MSPEQTTIRCREEEPNDAHSIALFLNGAFFAAQILPHWWTGLLNFSVEMMYGILALGAFGLICLSGLITFVLWIKERCPFERKWLRRLGITIALMATTAVLCTVINLMLARGLPRGSFAQSFDSMVWTDAQSSRYMAGDITTRQKMLGDAIRSVVRNGTRTQIAAVLGPPNVGRLTTDDWTYMTGPERTIPIDSEWLSIWFDESGRVKRWKVWTD